MGGRGAIFLQRRLWKSATKYAHMMLTKVRFMLNNNPISGQASIRYFDSLPNTMLSCRAADHRTDFSCWLVVGKGGIEKITETTI